MRPKSLILLSLALGCGLVAALGINQMMARQTPGVAATGETVEIYVTLKDMNTNDLIKPEDIKVEPWPKDKVPQDAISKLEDVKNRRARTKLFAGEPLREAKLLAAGDAGTGAADSIPAGFRVVSVRVDAVKSSGNLIKPGDRVDVIVHLQQATGRGDTEPVSKTFLQDVRVFAVNDLIDRPESGGSAKVVAQTISLLVKPDQVELVTLAEEMGKVRLSMRSPNDEDTANTEGAMTSNLLGTANSSQRAEESLPPSSEPAAPANPLVNMLERLKGGPTSNPVVVEEKSAFKMTIIRGPEIEEIEMDEHGKIARPKKNNETPALEPVEATLLND